MMLHNKFGRFHVTHPDRPPPVPIRYHPTDLRFPWYHLTGTKVVSFHTPFCIMSGHIHIDTIRQWAADEFGGRTAVGSTLNYLMQLYIHSNQLLANAIRESSLSLQFILDHICLLGQASMVTNVARFVLDDRFDHSAIETVLDSVIVDIYTICRMFNQSTVPNMQQIIVVMGNAHITRISNLLTKMDGYAAGTALTSDIPCLDIPLYDGNTFPLFTSHVPSSQSTTTVCSTESCGGVTRRGTPCQNKIGKSGCPDTLRCHRHKSKLDGPS
jgi:hypothetical protein